MQITVFECALPAWPPKRKMIMVEEIAMAVSGIFVEERRQILLASDKNKRDQKNHRSKPVDYSPKLDNHKQETLKHRKKTKRIEIHWSQITNHDLLN